MPQPSQSHRDGVGMYTLDQPVLFRALVSSEIGMGGMKSIKDYEGESILIRSIVLDETQPVTVRLHLMEDAGIWVESQKMTNDLLGVAKVSMSPRTAVVFVPWTHVAWIMGSLDVPSIADSTSH